MGYFRKQEENRRLEKLYGETKSRYGGGAYFNKKKERIVRYYIYSKSHGGNPRKYFSRVGNRRIRRMGEELPKKSAFKRYFDLWWTLI